MPITRSTRSVGGSQGFGPRHSSGKPWTSAAMPYLLAARRAFGIASDTTVLTRAAAGS